MAEREVLGQGVVELLLEDAKLKPALAAAKKLIEDTLGPAVGDALGGGSRRRGGGKRGVLAGLAAQAAKDGARAGKGISKGLSGGLVAAAKSGSVLTKQLGSVANQAATSGGRMSLLRRSLDRLSGGFRGAAGSGMGFGRMLAAVTAGNIFAKMVGKIASGLKQLIGAGFNTSAMMETLSVSFTQLVGNEKAAQSLLRTLREFSAGTPLQFPDVTKAATSLLATQAIAQDKLLPTIKKLTDAAAGSTEGFAAFPRVVRAISQMLSKGKVQAEEMLQLAEAGIPAWGALASAMGMSVAEVQKLSSEGKLGVSEIMKLIDGLGDQYAGLAKKQSQTFRGLMSTLKDQVGFVAANITKPFFELAKIRLKNLTEWMNSDGAKRFFSTVEAGVSLVAKLVDSAMNSPLVRTIAIIGGVATAAVAMAAAVGTAVAAIASVLNPVTITIGVIAAAVAGLGASFKAALDSPYGKEIRQNLIEIKDLAIEIGTNVVDTIKSAWDSLRSTFGSVFQSVSDSNGQFWLKVTSGIRNFLDLISLMSSDWGAAWDFMRARSMAMLLKVREAVNQWTGGISEVIIAGVKEWWTQVKAFGSFVIEVFGKIWRWVTTAVGGMSKSLGSVSEAFTIENIVRGIGAVIGAGKAMVSQFRAAFIEIGNLASAEAAGVIAVFRKQFERLKAFADPDTWLSPSKMKAALGGLSEGANPVGQARTFMDAFNKTLASQEQPDFLNYGDAMKAEGDRLVEMLRQFREKMSGENTEGIAEAERAMQEAFEKMRKSRDRKRREREAVKDEIEVKDDGDDKLNKGMKKLGDQMKETADQFGKTDIEGLHDAVQDALNKRGKSPELSEAEKQTDVLEDIRDGKGRDSSDDGSEKTSFQMGSGSGSASGSGSGDGMAAADDIAAAVDKFNTTAKEAGPRAEEMAREAAREERRAAVPEGFDIVDDMKKRLQENLANRGGASGDPATASDIARAIRESLDAAGVADTRRRSATEAGRMIQERSAQNLENASIARMLEQFMATAQNQGLAPDGQTAMDALAAIAPVSQMDGGDNRSVELQKAMLDELKRRGGDGEKLVQAFQSTGDKIINNMGFGE